MEVVLEMAHKIEDKSNPNVIPSRDGLIEKVIFKLPDIVEICAKNVDLDYACKGK